MINHALCTTIPKDEPENEVKGLQNLSAPSAGYLAASASQWHEHDVMGGTMHLPLDSWASMAPVKSYASGPAFLHPRKLILGQLFCLFFFLKGQGQCFLLKGRWYLKKTAPRAISSANPQVDFKDYE